MEKRAAVVVGGPRRGPRGTLRSRMWSISALGEGSADCMYCATLSGNSTSNYADDCNYTVLFVSLADCKGGSRAGVHGQGGSNTVWNIYTGGILSFVPGEILRVEDCFCFLSPPA